MTYLKTLQWKKNREFGDIHGGRMRRRMSDNIFARLHSLKRPGPDEELPILMEDNPSRDFFHPLSAAEASAAIAELPNGDGEGITHIWCRRLSHDRFNGGEKPFGEFICGSGVRLVVLYAWPKSMELAWKRKPPQKFVNELERLGIKLNRRKSGFFIKPAINQLRRFYVQSLLFHEIGHHVDFYNRLWSAANSKQCEEFADQYAMQYSDLAIRVVDNFDTVGG